MNTKELIKGNEREVKDVFYLIALQGISYLVPIIVLPYLMAVLGAEKFGCIGFAIAVSQYLMILVDFGFNLSATKRIALAKEDQEELNRVFSSTFYAKMFLLAISFLIVVALSFIPKFEVYRPAMFVMFLTVLGNAFLFVFLFQGLGKIRWVSIINCIVKISVLPLTFVFVKQPDDYLIAAGLQGVVCVISAIISIMLIIKNDWVKLLGFNKYESWAEVKDSFPIFLSIAATSAYTVCFVLILGYFTNPQEVGRYSATDRVVRALCLGLLTPVLQAFYPKVCSLAKNCKSDALTLSKTILLFTVAGMICISLCLVFIASRIENWLGADYTGTEQLFYIMSPIPILIGIGGVIGQCYLLAIGDDIDKRRYKTVYYIAATLALIAVFILTPLFEAMGTAIAVLLTELIVTVGMITQSMKLKTEDK